MGGFLTLTLGNEPCHTKLYVVDLQHLSHVLVRIDVSIEVTEGGSQIIGHDLFIYSIFQTTLRRLNFRQLSLKKPSSLCVCVFFSFTKDRTEPPDADHPY